MEFIKMCQKDCSAHYKICHNKGRVSSSITIHANVLPTYCTQALMFEM